ncbi:MAG: endopeptidase La [Clostridia bacterium]|nr:endopeptidase La [Clostridia bacterium]
MSEILVQENNEIINLPVLSVRGTVAFPTVTISLDIIRPLSLKALSLASKADGRILLLTQKDSSVEDPSENDFYRTGTVCVIKQAGPLPEGGFRAVFEGLCRAKVLSLNKASEGCFVAAAACEDAIVEPVATVKTTALYREALALLDAIAEVHPSLSDEMRYAARGIHDLSRLADFIASGVLLSDHNKQMVLDIRNPLSRMEKLLVLMAEELDILRCEYEIHRRVKSKIDANQKEFFLREQVRAIQQELGEGGDDECEEYYSKIEKAKLPKEVAEKLNKEVSRMAKTPYGSAEGTVIRNYLDVCLDIPWTKTSQERPDVAAAAKILNADHDGLDKVKERILEYIAVKQLSPDLRNQIICLVGPPGVGKTSIAASVARALKRKYVRVSLGGIKDESDIRGHRKTYVASMPGRIIEALTQAKVRNPLIVLDEIDKISSSLNGDPSSALLEVLDPEQNKYFRDHFVEIPIDLSDCMFIATANSYEGIPLPLIDRMEIIELSTYSRREKHDIAMHHLIDKQLKRHGLTKRQVKFTEEAIYEVIDFYTREAGVRNLERRIADLCRKAAREIAEGKATKVTFKADNIISYLGKHKVRPEKISTRDYVGVVNGLAYTAAGGDLLQIEASVMEGTGKLELTGSLGDVMKESAHIAYSYVRSIASRLNIDPQFYKNNDLHIHVPEGAVPKDGPSAGVTMTCAIASALSGLPVRRDIAMTGEVTLRGRVMAIGGLKEKTLAAYSAGVKTVLIPKENAQDMDEIDPQAREGLTFIFCENVQEVLAAALIGYGEKPMITKKEVTKESVVPQPLLGNPTAGKPVGAATV